MAERATGGFTPAISSYETAVLYFAIVSTDALSQTASGTERHPTLNETVRTQLVSEYMNMRAARLLRFLTARLGQLAAAGRRLSGLIRGIERRAIAR